MDEIHVAAYNGDISTLRKLLAEGAIADTRDADGFTPLQWASFRARVADMVPIIKDLGAAGADPDAVTGPGDANCLILAVQCGGKAAVEALISIGADVNRAADGVTALMQAARDGDTKIVDLLLRHGANPSLRCGPYSAADYARYGGFNHLANRLRRLADATPGGDTSSA